jgi:hypothetical protein
MAASRRQIVAKLFNARHIGDRLTWTLRTGRRLGRIPLAQPVDMIHLLSARIVRLQVLAGSRK